MNLTNEELILELRETLSQMDVRLRGSVNSEARLIRELRIAKNTLEQAISMLRTKNAHIVQLRASYAQVPKLQGDAIVAVSTCADALRAVIERAHSVLIADQSAIPNQVDVQAAWALEKLVREIPVVAGNPDVEM